MQFSVNAIGVTITSEQPIAVSSLIVHQDFAKGTFTVVADGSLTSGPYGPYGNTAVSPTPMDTPQMPSFYKV